MADLKTFYAAVKPTAQAIEELNFNSQKFRAGLIDQKTFMDYANTAFGMMAHWNLVSTEALITFVDQSAKLRVSFDDYARFCVARHNFNIIVGTHPFYLSAFSNDSEHYRNPTLCKSVKLNPSAVPVIQRYRTMFDQYETQNGFTPLYKTKFS